MALSERGKKYLKVGGAIVVVIAGIEIARRMQKGGPAIDRRGMIGRTLIKEEDVGWGEQREGMAATEDEVLSLMPGDELLVMEVLCYDDACTKVEGPIGLARYTVAAVGPEGIVLKKGMGFLSKGPEEVIFEGVGYSWVSDVAPLVRRVRSVKHDNCTQASPELAAHQAAQGLVCDSFTGQWVSDPQQMA